MGKPMHDELCDVTLPDGSELSGVSVNGGDPGNLYYISGHGYEHAASCKVTPAKAAKAPAKAPAKGEPNGSSG